MWLKSCYIYLCFLGFIYGDKSFTIVLDTTTSMEEELDVIKVNLPNAIYGSNNTLISNYILVPFNDPDVGVPTVILTARELLSSLNTISARGGRKCPENSLSGIEKALEISKPRSNIFVFTDAYSKDVHKLRSVENLCRSTKSQVVIFLTGFCSSKTSPTVNEQVYHDVAGACSGAVLYFDPGMLRQAFNYIKEVINVEWTDIRNYIASTENQNITFSVDSFTKTVLVVASGDNLLLEKLPSDSSRPTVEKITDTRHTQVVRLLDPLVGDYTAIVRGRNKTTVVIYKRYELPLRFGFSTKLPRSMSETSRKPMPGRLNNILIDATQSNMKLETIEIEMATEQERKALVFQEYRTTGMYLSNSFIEPDKSFRIWVKGYDKSNYQEIKGSSEYFILQQATTADSRWTEPQAEILDAGPLTLDFGKNTTLACKVTGYPEPSVTWENDNGVILPSENVLLEIPSVYISYVNVENATVNSTIYCKSKNSQGEDSQSINLYVYRPFKFDVIQTPSDQTIEYGGEGRLYCEVSAYPPADTKWYFNDTEVTSSDNLMVDSTNALLITNMTVNNIGEYKCLVRNEANENTYSAFVKISGIEAPQVEVENTNMTLKLGDWINLECRVLKGKPSPIITWGYKSEDAFDFGPLPDGVVADDTRLKIASVQPEHKGVYRCDGTNIEGQHSVEVTVLLQYPPSISNAAASTLTVKEEDDVVLPCEVVASPPASVRWEMSQDDVLVAFDDRHHTDRRNTHIFKALWKDSGNYHCIAENNIGRAEKTITVNVLVAPYIEAPKRKRVVAKTGDNFVLTCNVLYGNPAPSTKWEFIAPDSTTKVLNRSNSSSLLRLVNVSYTDEGSYLCIANNSVGTDSINIYVKIQ